MFFIYQWTNKRNNKMYIGSHEGELSDGYIGSGVYFKRAYRREPENFERSILSIWPTRREMMEAEERLLTENNAAASASYYNLCNASGGGYLHRHLTEERRLEIYTNRINASVNKLSTMLIEDREILANKKRESWKKSPKLEAHREKTSARMKLKYAKMSKEERQIISESSSKAYWARDLDAILKHRDNHSKAAKLSYERNPTLKQSRSEHFKKVNAGRVYLHKGGVIRRVVPNEVDILLGDGWIRGIGPKKPRV